MSKFPNCTKWGIPVMVVCSVALASKWSPVKTDFKSFQKRILFNIHILLKILVIWYSALTFKLPKLILQISNTILYLRVTVNSQLFYGYSLEKGLFLTFRLALYITTKQLYIKNMGYFLLTIFIK